MKTAPFATCWTDDEPLISTFEFPKYEWFCQVCGTKYGYLDAKPAQPTLKLAARHDQLKGQYQIARAEREASK